MLRVHVIPEGTRWAVRVLGATVVVHREQWQAAQAAQLYAEQNGGGEVLIRDSLGQVERQFRVMSTRRYS